MRANYIGNIHGKFQENKKTVEFWNAIHSLGKARNSWRKMCRKISHFGVLKKNMLFRSMEIFGKSNRNFWLKGERLQANLKELMQSSPPIKSNAKFNHVLTYTAFCGCLLQDIRFNLGLWFVNSDNSDLLLFEITDPITRYLICLYSVQLLNKLSNTNYVEFESWNSRQKTVFLEHSMFTFKESYTPEFSLLSFARHWLWMKLHFSHKITSTHVNDKTIASVQVYVSRAFCLKMTNKRHHLWKLFSLTFYRNPF